LSLQNQTAGDSSKSRTNFTVDRYR